MIRNPMDEDVDWQRVFSTVFADLGVDTGEPDEVRERELSRAVEQVRDAVGAEALIVVELLPSGPNTIVSAGRPAAVPADRVAELMRRIADADAAELDGTMAIAVGEPTRVAVIAHPAPRSDQARATLRIVTAWLSSERRRADRLRGWVQQTHDDKYQSLSHFAVRAAHDFRNSLAAILSHAEFVLDRLDENQISHQVLEDVVLAARQASAQVDTLMAFGGLLDRPIPDPVRLQPQIEGMLPVLRALVPSHIELSTVIDPDTAAGIQPTHLRQLLVNLVTNAAQAIGSGRGHIELRVKARERPNPAVEIIVEDDGPGMDATVRRRATDPFFSTHKGNRGLGLAVAMGIARGVGGDLALASEPGRGTRVRITVPSRAKPSPMLA